MWSHGSWWSQSKSQSSSWSSREWRRKFAPQPSSSTRSSFQEQAESIARAAEIPLPTYETRPTLVTAAVNVQENAPSDMKDEAQPQRGPHHHVHVDQTGTLHEIPRASHAGKVRHRSQASQARREANRDPEKAEESVISQIRACEDELTEITKQLNVDPNDQSLFDRRKIVREHVAILEERVVAHRERRAEMRADKAVGAAMRASSVSASIAEEDEDE